MSSNNYSLLPSLLKLLKLKKNISEKISNSKRSLLNENDAAIVETFLFGLNDLNDKDNVLIIESTIEYIITTERFIASHCYESI